MDKGHDKQPEHQPPKPYGGNKEVRRHAKKSKLRNKFHGRFRAPGQSGIVSHGKPANIH
jgi:hypothetical protein